MGRARRPRRPRRPRKRRQPDWLPAALAVTAQLLAVVVAVLNGVGVPVTGECPRGERRPPVAAVVRDYGGKLAESEASSSEGAEATYGLTWANLVGRDGIEPPTLRFSAARSTD
jgi:hypothetical protein